MVAADKNKKIPHVLMILDGFGYREDEQDNAVAAATTPNLDKINSKMRQPNFKKERIDSERKDDSNHQKRHSYPEQMSQECLEVYLLLIGHRLALEMEIS